VTKPTTKDGHTPEELVAVKSTLLHLASVVGDLMDEIVIVGGLVPTLLTDAGVLERLDEPHVGTSDLDVGLSLALLDDELYTKVSSRLRGADFEPDVNDQGNRTRQRWVWKVHKRIRVDFLIPRSPRTLEGTRVQSLERGDGRPRSTSVTPRTAGRPRYWPRRSSTAPWSTAWTCTAPFLDRARTSEMV